MTDTKEQQPPAAETSHKKKHVDTDRHGIEKPDFIDDPRGGKDRNGSPCKIADPADKRTPAWLKAHPQDGPAQ